MGSTCLKLRGPLILYRKGLIRKVVWHLVSVRSAGIQDLYDCLGLCYFRKINLLKSNFRGLICNERHTGCAEMAEEQNDFTWEEQA